MSKFIDKLSSSFKETMPAMGFRTSGSEEKPLTLMAAVELTGRPEDEVKEFTAAEAAAGILDAQGLSAPALSKFIKGRGNMALGLVLSTAKYSAEVKLISADIDFVIFDLNMPVKIFDGKEFETAGKILRISTNMEAGLLRSINELYPAVDAVMVDLSDTSLTIESLMNCRKAADFSGQHILARVNKSLSRTELAALRECGVKCLVLPPDASVEDFIQVREDISSLPKAGKKKDWRGVALLPRIEPGRVVEEDEGDDDD